MLPAHRGQPGQAVAARHVQVEQQQVDVRVRAQRGQRRRQVGGFANAAARQAVFGSLAQRGTEQRMVVGNQQTRHVRQGSRSGRPRRVAVAARRSPLDFRTMATAGLLAMVWR